MSVQNPLITYPIVDDVEFINLRNIGATHVVGDQYQNLFYDDFSLGVNVPWAKSVGTGGTLARTTAAAEFSSGGAAFKWTSGVTISEVQTVERHIGFLPDIKLVAFGVRFAILDESPEYFRFILGKRDGTNFVRAVFDHFYTTNLWRYDTGGVGAENMTTLLTRDAHDGIAPPRWHNLLIVADFQNNKYRTIIMDDNANGVATIGAQPLRSSADATLPGTLSFGFEFKNTAAPAAANVLIDLAYGVVLD